MKNRHILPLAAIMLVVGIITFGVIFLIPWLPAQASVEAQRTDQLVWFMTVVSGVIFTVVTSFVIYSAWAFRAAPGDESDGPPMHGNTKLEIVWTAVPVVLVAIIAGWSVVITQRNDQAQKVQDVVHVKAWQYAWEFDYPSLGMLRPATCTSPSGPRSRSRSTRSTSSTGFGCRSSVRRWMPSRA